MEKKTNYRAHIRLVPQNRDADNWTHLIKLLANWINHRNPNESTKSKIYGGIRNGELQYRNDGIEVTVISEHKGPDGVKYLAIRFSHDEGEGPMVGLRKWINEIGIEVAEDGSYLFAMSNAYQIRNAFIGDVEEPQITSPNILKKLVSDKNWQAFVSTTRLSVEPIHVTHENVKDFREFIFDKARQIPLVYVSLDANDKFHIDPYELALKVVGNALVYCEFDRSVGKYLKSYPHFDQYRCTGGAVRIYLPGANLSNKSDPFRHRFFTTAHIERESPISILGIIAESIVRRSIFVKPFPIQGIGDLERARIQAQLETALTSNKSDQIIESYKAQVENLKDELSKTQAECVQYCAWYDEKDDETGRLEEVVESMETKFYELRLRNQILEDQINAAELASTLPDYIPQNLSDLLEIIEQHYPKYVVVLNDAKNSARDYEVKDINKAWKLLKSIPEKLYPIMFNGSGDKRAQYQNESGFELSMTESKMTKADRRLSSHRAIEFNGKEVDMNSHVGYGSHKSSLLRVYFHISPEARKIVIGHCGDHLPTFSSRTMH